MSRAAGPLRRREHLEFLIVVLALASAAGWWVVWTASYGVPIHDDAFLLQGLDRVLQGDVPVRDFQSYDPGRYWLLAPFRIGGRIGRVWVGGHVLVFAASLALVWSLRPLTTRLSVLAATVLPLLVLWTVPTHKSLDVLAAEVLLLAAMAILRRPDRRRLMLAGAALGIVAMIGRNHGVYGLVALTGATLLADSPPGRARLRNLLPLAGGTALGWSPMLILLAADEQMRARLVADLLRMRSAGTNLALPVPFPWAGTGAWTSPTSWGFVIIPLLVLAALAVGVRHRQPGAPWATVALAAGLVGTPYLHHGLDRADLTHLAQIGSPAIIAAAAMAAAAARSPVRLRRRCLPLLLGLAVLLPTWAVIQAWPGVAGMRAGEVVVDQMVDGEVRRLPPAHVAYVAAAEEVHALLSPQDTIFVAPRDIGLYLLLDRTPPAYRTYMSTSAPGEQEQMLLEVAQVDYFAVRPDAYSANPATLFSTSHPEVWTALLARCDPPVVIAWFEIRPCPRTAG